MLRIRRVRAIYLQARIERADQFMLPDEPDERLNVMSGGPCLAARALSARPYPALPSLVAEDKR